MPTHRYREGLANGEDLAALKVSDPNNAATHYRPGSKNGNKTSRNEKQNGKPGGSKKDTVKEYSYDKGTGTQHK